MATFILNKETQSRILEFSQEIRELRQCVQPVCSCIALYKYHISIMLQVNYILPVT